MPQGEPREEDRREHHHDRYRSSINGEELALLAASFAAAIAKGKNSCELQTLINFFSMVDQNLVIILAQKRCNNVRIVDILP